MNSALARDLVRRALSLFHLRAGGTSFDIANLDSVTFEALFRLPDVTARQWLGSPRIELGGAVNLRGRESVAHAGLNSHLPVFDTSLILEMGWRIGIHHGSGGCRSPASQCRIPSAGALVLVGGR